MWASDITPVTGKWRIETVEINGPVQIGEVRLAAGDLVVADDTGVCFIPRDVVLEVLDAAEQKAKAVQGDRRRYAGAGHCARDLRAEVGGPPALPLGIRPEDPAPEMTAGGGEGPPLTRPALRRRRSVPVVPPPPRLPASGSGQKGRRP